MKSLIFPVIGATLIGALVYLAVTYIGAAVSTLSVIR